MLKNYIKITLRNLRRSPGYSFINITGLAVGLACCMLIALFVRDELAYDRQHPDVDQLYRLTSATSTSNDVMNVAMTPAVYSKAFYEEYPAVENYVRVHPSVISMMFKQGNERFYEDNVVFTDPSFFSLFGFKLRSGDPKTVLEDPYTVVVSPDIAKKYFGNSNAVGQTLRVNNEFDLTVTGVLESDPVHTHLSFDILVSMATVEALEGVWFYGRNGAFLNSWHLAAGYGYVRLDSGTDPEKMTRQLNELIKRNVPEEQAKYELSLQPVRDIHLRSNLQYEMQPGGNIVHIWVFTIVALFILAIACVNYMNLATARSIRRGTEVGIRKAIGANRSQLIRQFLGESMVLVLFVLVLALVIATYSLPVFNYLTNKTLSQASLLEPGLIAGLVLVTLATGFFAGLYPAFFLSNFNPSRVLKGDFASREETGGGSTLRKGLVVFQFTASIVLIIGTLTVFEQLQYFQNKDLGYESEHVVTIPLRNDSIMKEREVLKQKMKAHPNVLQVAATSTIPGDGASRHDVKPEGQPQDERWLISFYGVDYDFIETMGFDIITGRSFSQEFGMDSTQSYILNEAAVERLGWQDDAVGREFTWINPRKGVQPGRVIGVVRDFHYEPLRQPVEPAFFAVAPDWIQLLTIRLRPGNVRETMASLENIWNEIVPGFPFDYQFQDDQLDQNYRSEKRFGSLFGTFAVLAIFIACLGLVGLAAYASEQRRQEIGVRKVLGATTGQLIILLSKDFMKLIIIGFVIAVPIAWLAMNRWLADFAYRIELGADLFLISGAAAVFIALLTVSWQSVRAALANPVDSLRSE